MITAVEARRMSRLYETHHCSESEDTEDVLPLKSVGEIEDEIKNHIRNGDRRFTRYVGDHQEGQSLVQEIEDELIKNGYRAHAVGRYISDSSEPLGYYWKHDIYVEW